MKTLSRPALLGLFVALIAHAQAQASPDTLAGTVLDSASHQPVGHALVFSPDNRYATFTDDRGHFEFQMPTSSESTTGASSGPLRPTALMARHPGFLETPDNVPISDSTRNVTIRLTPEALIVGRVELSSKEARARFRVSLYQKAVNDGRAQWRLIRQALTRSNGEFRFADLGAGSYRVFTNEELDRDPEATIPGGPLYGYPPVYYPAATDFEASSVLSLLPGKHLEILLTLVRQRYYPVAIPVGNAVGPLEVQVRRNGSSSPGYELGYSPLRHQIEGMLPEGNYKIEGITYADPTLYGMVRLTVTSAGTQNSSMVLTSTASVPVEVKQEFHSSETVRAMSGRRSGGALAGIELVPAEESDARSLGLQFPQRPGEPLMIHGAHPGKYWVHVFPHIGYAGSVNAGGVDLIRNTLDIDRGGSVPAIEIVLRDGTARLRGVIEGSPADGSDQKGTQAGSAAEFAHVYCVPQPDNNGQFAEVSATSTGEFDIPTLVPGVYRILAFRTPQTELEYRNAEAMRAYDSKGIVLRLVEDQTEKIRLPLASEE